MSARELVYARLTDLVDELLLHDPLVRAEAPDAVHRMRIASRRLRSNLATYRRGRARLQAHAQSAPTCCAANNQGRICVTDCHGDPTS